MVAELNRHDDLSFQPIPDTLPPQNVEIEEEVLGGILSDPECIHRIKSRLKPEHFYFPAHKEIYRACLAVFRQGLPPDLPQVTNYLIDKKLLNSIGKNKLVMLLAQSVTTVNIDALAAVLIQKHARRELIKLGSDVTQFAYSGEIELEDVLELVRRRTEKVINLEAAKTQDELIKDRHDRLIAAIKHIYTTVESPSERLMRLMYLGREFDLSIKFLEQLYMKSLVDTCSTLMTYEDLKAAAGKNVREWLQQGLVPVGSSILLGADGGVGKTNLTYTIAKHVISGTNLGDFHSTGEKRRVLIYQGDEQPGDTAEKLELMGYDENDIGKYVRCRYGWSFENIIPLIKDVNEFEPHLIIFDSLSFGNRFSVYTENETEYARPILEINGILAEKKCTAIFIHHTNRDGGFRGATAIRNAVSEAWLLYPSKSMDATPYDRTLEISKSRSRSSGKKYKLYFDSYTLEYNFLGEEFQADTSTDDKGAKDRMLRFFHENRNTMYEAEEIGHLLHISSGHARKTLSALSADGLISVKRQPGKPNLYYMMYSLLRIADQGSHPRSPDDQQMDHPYNDASESDTAKGDPLIIENQDFSKNNLADFGKNLDQMDQQSPETKPVDDYMGDPMGDHQADHQVITGMTPTPVCNSSLQTDVIQLSIRNDEKPTKQADPIEPIFIKSKFPCAIGEVYAVAQSNDAGKTWELMWRYPVGKNKQKSESNFVGTDEEVRSKLKQRANGWINTQRYKVTVNDDVICRCKCVGMPQPRIGLHGYRFQSPDGQEIYIDNTDDFEWQAQGE